MAVRASDQVTLAVVASPTYVRLYYLKQASTLSPPEKPTTNPPASPWSTTEPTYSPGSTDTLYTVMLTAYGSSSFEYGDVQKSSSFEAAKQAYNKANNSVASTRTEYAIGTNHISAPTTGWGTNLPSRQEGEVLWFRTVTITAAGAEFNGTPAPVTGDQGVQGISVTSITPYYRKLASSASAPDVPTTMTPSGWVETELGWDKNYVLYKTERVVLSNGTFQYTPVTKVEAWSAADSAQAAADDAKRVAENALWSMPNLVTKAPYSQFGWGLREDGTFVRSTNGGGALLFTEISVKPDQVIRLTATWEREGEAGNFLCGLIPRFLDGSFEPGKGWTPTDNNRWTGVSYSELYPTRTRDYEIPEDVYSVVFGAWVNNNAEGEPVALTSITIQDVTEIVRLDAEIETVKDSALYESRVEYAVNNSETTEPTSGWSTSQPTRTPGSFIWIRTVITYGSGNTSTTAAALLTGNTGAKGVSVSAITPYFQLAKNYAPDITVPGAKVEIARNLAKNPFCVSGGGVIPTTNNLNYYSAVLTSDLAAPHPLGITTGMVGERLSGSGYTILSVYRLDGYTHTNAPADRKIGVWIYVNNDGYRAASVLNNDWGSLDLPANEWVFVTTVNTVLSTYNSGISITRVGHSPSEGDKAWITGIVSVDASKDTVPGTFFGGTISDDPDFTSEWAGAENNSESILYGIRTSHILPRSFTNSEIILSTWAGIGAARIVPTGTTSTRLIIPVPPEIQGVGTMRGLLGLKHPLDGVLRPEYALTAIVSDPQKKSQPTPNLAGSHPVELQWSSLTTGAILTLYNGASIGNGDVWWTDLGLYEGDLTAPTVEDPPDWTTSQPTYPNNGDPYDILTTERVDYDNGTFTWTPVTKVPLVTGPRGQDGLPGNEGLGIKSTEITYSKSTSSTTAPTTGWGPTPPTAVKGQYLWIKMVWTYTDDSVETGYSTSYWAKDGTDGDDGAPGIGITNTAVTYAQHTSGTTAPTSGWGANPPTPIVGRYVWTKIVWTYTNGTTGTSYSVGKIGETGSDGRGIVSATVTYQSGTSATSAPTGTWVANPPTVAAGNFLWTRTITTYTSGSDTTSYSVARQGANGNPGSAGVGVSTSVVTYQSGTSGTTPPTGTWVANPPTVAAGNFLWTRTIITYTNSTTSTLYSAAKQGEKGNPGDQGISITKVTPYYRLSATALSTPTVKEPSGWVTTEPAYVVGMSLYISDRIDLSNGTFQWTAVRKSSSYTASSEANAKADNALHIGNLAKDIAEGKVWIGPTEPPLAKRVEGQIWIKTEAITPEDGSDPEDRMVGVYHLQNHTATTAVWDIYTLVTGMIIVPGDDGTPTIIDQNGAYIGKISAESISAESMAADSVGAKQVIVGSIDRGKLDPVTGEIIDDSESLLERVVIGQGTITISRSKMSTGGTPTTGMQLDASRMSFFVQNEVAAYIDSEAGIMNISKGVFEDTVVVGEHEISRLGENNITIFRWIGS